MFRRVGQRLLNDAVEGYFHGTRQPADNCRFDLNAEVRALCNSFRQETDRRYPAKVIQDRGPKFMGIPPQLLFNLAEQFFNPSKLFSLRLRQLARHVCERKMNGHEKLPGLIVHGIGDALDLFLKRLIELPESSDRVLNSTVCHFIGREGLCQKFGSGGQQFLAPRCSFGIGEHPVERLMVQGSDFHEAFFLANGAASQIVSAAQGGLATTLGVFTKRGTIFFLKRRRQLRVPFVCRLHAQIPVSRTTKTSASSFPRPCCLRILSAARCGDSKAERPSTNSPRIPSVTKTRVSPFRIGSTAACRAGNCEPTTPPRKSSTSPTLPFWAPARIKTPCTFPTPSQVIRPCFGSMEARLSTTPRVERRPSWQRSSREMTGSSGLAFRMANAASAALAASSPCPIPSIAAIRIPSPPQQTTWRSPDSPWPGRIDFATPYSTNGKFIISTFSPSPSCPGRVRRQFQIRPSSVALLADRDQGFPMWRNRLSWLDECPEFRGRYRKQ